MMQTHLPNRSVIRLSGTDTDSLLQGIITQNIHQLETQPLIFSAMLSAQGKFQHDFFILKEGDSRLIDIDRAHQEAFLKKLKMYKLRADVTIEATELQVHAAWGDAPQSTGWHPDPRLDGMGWRKIDEAAGDDHSQTYHAHRLALGVPDGALDATDRHFVLELGYDQLNGVSFSKGCFVGQEPTARMHYRNVLRKCLFQVRSDSPLPQAGTEIRSGEKILGEMRSSAGQAGLAFCRIDPVDNATAPIMAAEAEIRLILPPYMQAKVEAIKAAE